MGGKWQNQIITAVYTDISKNYVKIILLLLTLQHPITYQPLVMHHYRIKNNRIPL